MKPGTLVEVTWDDGTPKGWTEIKYQFNGKTVYGYVFSNNLDSVKSINTTPNTSANRLAPGTVLGEWIIDSWDSRISFWPSNNPGVNDSWGNAVAANYKLATVTVEAGSGFSWYTNVGYSVPGYGPGGILSAGKPAVGFGGGACGTVNALNLALLDAIEQHGEIFVFDKNNRKHSVTSTYVPNGMPNVTISSPDIDYKFKNTSGYDITFKAICIKDTDANGATTRYRLGVQVVVAE